MEQEQSIRPLNQEQVNQLLRDYLFSLDVLHDCEGCEGEWLDEHRARIRHIEETLTGGYTRVPEELRNGKE